MRESTRREDVIDRFMRRTPADDKTANQAMSDSWQFYPIDDDAGFGPGETRYTVDPVTAPSTTYDRSPADALSISNYSPSLLDTAPSSSNSPNNPTYPNLNLYASESPFTSPHLGNGDSSLSFGEFSPSTPSFYPFVNGTDSGSLDDPLNNLTLPSHVPSPVAGFSNFAVSPTGDMAYAAQGHPQQQLSTGDASIITAMGLSPNKRAKLAPEEDRVGPGRGAPHRRGGVNRPLQPAIPRPTGLAGSSQTIKPKLRSASSSSKNLTPHRSTETPKERKERNSHNLVEKKYRNRLNAQYEGLMNSLPPEMQSPTRVTASSASSDQAEKPLSKGEVLEKSTAYIQELERDHLRLKEEHEELSRNIERLCSMLAGGAGDGGDDLGGPAG